MSDNLKLIQYFTAQFYNRKSRNLAHFVSPAFYYKVNDGEKETFDFYIHRMEAVYRSAISITSDPRTDDDQTFYIDYVITVKSDGKSEKLYGTAKYFVLNGLLENIHIKHHNDKQDIERLRDVLMKKEEAQPTSFFV